MQKINPGTGYNFSSNRSGFTLDIPQQLPEFHPFMVQVHGDKLYVEPGMIRSLIPCLGSSSESKLLTNKEKPFLTITSKSDQYIYIRAGAEDKKSWPSNSLGNSKYPTIIAESSIKTDDVNYGYILIASLTYDNGYKVNQMIKTSLYGERHKFSDTQVSYYIWRV